MQAKQCISCNESQPLSEFYAHPMMADGSLNKCKTCCKRQARAYGRAWRTTRPVQYAEKSRRDAAWRKAKAREARFTKEEQSVVSAGRSKERVRRWVERHPERHAELRRRAAMKRYALKLVAPGFATTEQVRARWEFYGNRCWMCGAEATQTDHVIPLKKGGSDWPANQRPACGYCNRQKSALVFDLSEVRIFTSLALRAA